VEGTTGSDHGYLLIRLTKSLGIEEDVLSISGKNLGVLACCCSSRLNIQYRVVYKIEKDLVLVQVVNVTPHDYRRK
jgi:hypothetical protein